MERMTGPPPPTWAVDPATAGAREVTRGLWRLRIPLGWVRPTHVNAYAIARDDGLLLVDSGSAGHPSAAAALEKALADAGYRLEDVSAVVLTHAHSDHCGLAGLLRERSGAPIWGHPDDGHFYDARVDPRGVWERRRERARREGVPDAELGAFADVREELEGALPGGRPDRPLREGTTFASALGPWEAIETPGHAPSHVCLVQRQTGIAIVGDLICASFFPWMDYGYTPDPVAELLTSLDRLEGVGVELALPGHGRPLEGVGDVIAEHRDSLHARLEETVDALAAAPTDGHGLTVRTHGEAVGLTGVENTAETLAYLRHLRLGGRVERTTTATGRHLYSRAGSPPRRTA